MTKRPKGKRVPTGDYSTGYCKPPKRYQFKPGHKRNSSPNAPSADSVEGVLAKHVEVIQGGKKRRIHPYEASLWAAVQKGLKGNVRSLKWALGEFENAKLLEPSAVVSSGVIEVPKGISIEAGGILASRYGPPPWPQEEVDHLMSLYPELHADWRDLVLNPSTGFSTLRNGSQS
jgi:hypothetical protein